MGWYQVSSFPIHSIPTRGALTWHPFVISGHTFLGMANYYDSSQKHNTQSAVYQASGSQFVKYQEISTHGARDMTSFEYKKAFKSYSHASPSNQLKDVEQVMKYFFIKRCGKRKNV